MIFQARKNNKHLRTLLVALLALQSLALLFSCASQPQSLPDPLEVLHAKNITFEDGRKRFQQIFCAILQDHRQELPDYMPCEKALVMDAETFAVPQARSGKAKRKYLVGLVPGLAWQCVRGWMDEEQMPSGLLSNDEYAIRVFEVDGLSSTEANGEKLWHKISGLPQALKQRPVILIGYSKGVIDILQAISAHPELSRQVVAVVSVAGAIGGSPLADDHRQSTLNLLAHIPGSGCDVGDQGALESLRPKTRSKWFATHRLPPHIRYYSVVAMPKPERISLALIPSYRALGGPRIANDGQIPIYNQVIPGSTLLAFANADHWAISIAVTRQMAINRATFADENEFPRWALLKAILRYVDQDLASLVYSLANSPRFISRSDSRRSSMASPKNFRPEMEKPMAKKNHETP